MSRSFEVFSSYAALMDGTQYAHLAAAFSSGRDALDSLGLSVTRLQISGLQGADSAGNKTGDSLGSGDMAVALAGATRLASNLRLGLTAKALQSEIAGYKSNMALAGDLGLTYTSSRFSKPLSVGMSVTNFGQGIKFRDQRDPLPTAINMGLSVPMGPATAVAEINRRVYEQRTEAGMGLEYGIGAVSLRAGYLARTDSGNLALKDQSGARRVLGGLSGGVGIHMGAARLDYAFSQQAVEFGTTQRIALSLQWGGPSGHRAQRPDVNWKANRDWSDSLIKSMGSY